MKIITNVWNFTTQQGSVITIGTFDGVHLGHQKIIEKIIDSGQKNDLIPTIFTFFPHPKMILQPNTAPKQIQTIEEKAIMLQNLGIQQLVIQSFDKNFADLSPEDFVKMILVEKLQVKKIIIGYDHRFGKDRTANITDLQHFGKKYNFEVEEIPAQEINEVAVSSTKIRKALEEGKIPEANAYLGYFFSFSGEVIHGKKLGKKLTFPTANIKLSANYKLIPKDGVYAIFTIMNGKKIFGMMNIGNNPTIDGKQSSIEVHFFDFEGNLYGKNLTIYLYKYIREEQKFVSIEALKHQLEKDEITIRNVFSSDKKNLKKISNP